MNSIDYSKDYWLQAHGACALCLLAIVVMMVFSFAQLGWRVGPDTFLVAAVVGMFCSLIGMGTARYGHSPIPFFLWLIPFAIVGFMCLLPVSH